MSTRFSVHLVLALLAVSAMPAHAQDAPTRAVPADSLALLTAPADTSIRHRLTLRDGTTLVGRIERTDSVSIVLRTSYGVVTARRAEVMAAVAFSASELHNGEYWPDEPNPTRLLFGPTARTLAQGDAYLADHYLFIATGAIGVTDRFTLGFGMSLFPTQQFLRNNLYFLLPKVAVVQQPEFSASVGALIATIPTLQDNGLNTFGMAYGVATWGKPDASFTVGAGYGFLNGKLADRPLLILGTEQRMTRRIAFISENYVLPGFNGALVSYGVRLINEKVGVDLAFLNSTTDAVFPGVPFVGVAFKF